MVLHNCFSIVSLKIYVSPTPVGMVQGRKGIGIEHQSAKGGGKGVELICHFPQEGPALETLLLELLRRQEEEGTPWRENG